MKRIFLSALVAFISIFLFSSLKAAELGIEVQDFSCKDGRNTIRFSVSNGYTYDRRTFLAFKIVKGDQVLECGSAALTLPANATETHETTSQVACEERLDLLYRLYDGRDRDKANRWLSDCPD